MGLDLKNMTNRVTQTVKNAADTVADAAGDLMQSLKTNTSGLLAEADKTANGKDTRNQMFQKICAFIPGKIDNQTVINALDIMRKQQHVAKKDFSSHDKANEAAFAKHQATISAAGGFIENQNAYTNMAYGDATMQFSGCEIFATYNAMQHIGGKNVMSLPQMIAAYEKDGIVLSGKFGTAPLAIADFLKKQGYKTEVSTNEADFDTLGTKHDGLILTMYNDKNDISKEVHTVNISKENGQFTAHNVYCNGKVVGPCKNVTELIGNINGGKARGISLIGISKS